jgi:aldehyde dehydrogenase (NAD+)
VTLLAYTSLDDAIDSLATVQQNALPALYVFAAPATAKYLSHFTKTHVSFVNHIPANLLGKSFQSQSAPRQRPSHVFVLITMPVGPVAPSGYPVSTATRYSREMFESPSPQFVSVAVNELGAADVVEVETSTFKRWHQAARHPLKPTGQPPEGDVNFFVQGLRAALVVYVLPVVLIGVLGTGIMGKKAFLYLKTR